MNKKITATTQKIYDAFKSVLNEKTYNEIKIQDILDRSGIARSTFYAHYKTKEDLLHSICRTIFVHVFSHTLEEEKSHDFSKTSIFEYKHFITHIFYHIHDERDLITAIFSSQSVSVFLDYIREELRPFAETCVKSEYVGRKNVPDDLQINSVIENFIVIVNYWILSNFTQAPEVLTEYFITVNS